MPPLSASVSMGVTVVSGVGFVMSVRGSDSHVLGMASKDGGVVGELASGPLPDSDKWR